MEKIPMTSAGFKVLQDELKRLKTIERPAVIQEISEARELGDLSENAEYHAALEQQSFLEGHIGELEDKLSRAYVIDISKLSGDIVKFGAIITLINEETDENVTYQIVGADESDIKRGLLSIASPLARALIGKKKSECISFTTPRGKKLYEILEVKFS